MSTTALINDKGMINGSVHLHVSFFTSISAQTSHFPHLKF